MNANNIFKELMKQYEKERIAAEYLSEMRKLEVYKAIPRIEAIDNELAKTGPLLVKEILSSSENMDKHISNFRTNSLKLQEEKDELLEAAGYPLNYIENVYNCPECKDTGFVDNINKCKCLEKRLITKHYQNSNIGDIFERENFDTFKEEYYDDTVDKEHGMSPRLNMRRIYDRCTEFANGFDDKFDNLLLYGHPGLGKTFLCNCIAKALLDKGHSVLYATAPNFFRKIEKSHFHRNEENEPDFDVEPAFTSDLLIIDDLGTEFITVFTSSELFNIINTRYANKKHVVISTNLSPDELNKIYSERLTSRILGTYAMLSFFGTDIRGSKKYSALNKNWGAASNTASFHERKEARNFNKLI